MERAIMLIKDFGRKSAHLKNSKLTNSKLWHKQTKDVLPLDLLIYLRQMKEQGEHQTALRDIEELQRLTILAMLEGQLNDAPYLSFAGEKLVMTLGEFACILHFANLSQMRKKALVFSLETGIKPEDVITLTRQAARRRSWTGFQQAIIDSVPVNMNLNYVFWEEFEAYGMHAPLFGLSQDLQDLFNGAQWHEIHELYKKAVKIDTFADAEEFVEILSSITEGHTKE